MTTEIIKQKPRYILDELRMEAEWFPLCRGLLLRIQWAPKGSGAVYAFPCFEYAKTVGKNPVTAAEELAKDFNGELGSALHKKEFPHSLIERFEATRGYLNVFAKDATLLARVIVNIKDYGEEYGNYPQLNKTVVVDYCSANIAKPLSVGHLRSTIIGQALINILKARGYKTVGINFMGDWGTQFGKLLVAFERWGSREELEKRPIPHLVDLYVQFHKEAEANPALEDEARAAFKRLGEGSEKEHRLWIRFREESLKAFEKTVARLGVHFDHNWFESDFEAKARKIIDELLARGVARESEGAVIIPIPSPLVAGEWEPPLVIRKSDGTTLYPTRDLASALERIKRWNPVRLFYVVASEQSLYFSQLWNALEEMREKGFYQSETPGISEYVRFGMVSLPSGKISTREGRVVYLDELLDEAERRAGEIIKEKNPEMDEEKRKVVARRVGIGAVIYADLSQDRIKDIVFDWSKMLAFDGNSAPYLQYAAVRCAKILEKAEPGERVPLEVLKAQDIAGLVEALEEPESVELLLLLGRFPQTVSEATQRYAPHVIAGYLYELATAFSRFYTQVPVLRSEGRTRTARLVLVEATGNVLRRGLELLGIETPDEM